VEPAAPSDVASETLRWLDGHLAGAALPGACAVALLDVVGGELAELDAEGEVAPVEDAPVEDGLVLVELLVPEELELSDCACTDRGPHPVRARTATPAVTAVATRVFMPL
jgi:hypothetical protein